MSEKELLSRVTVDTDICHGKPCLRGMRYPVEFILEMLSGPTTVEEFLNDYLAITDLRLAVLANFKHADFRWKRVIR